MVQRTYFFLVGVAALSLAVAGCTREPALSGLPPDAVRTPAADAANPNDGQVEPPAVQSSYRPYTKQAYEQALADGRPVLLYFYANWCPLCADQEPTVVAMFRGPDIAAWGIAAFRVNYDDSDTDSDERDLARQLGVNYQHTFFTFDRLGKQVWRATGTQTREQLRTRLEEIAK